MFGLSFMEIIVVCGIALIVLGPDQLPKVARSIGRMINEFKRATTDISGSLMGSKLNVHDIRRELDNVREKLNVTVASVTDPIKRPHQEPSTTGEASDESKTPKS